MPYTVTNYPSKRALKAAVDQMNETGAPFEWFQPGPFGRGTQTLAAGDSVVIEGPQSPAPHSFYARVLMTDGGRLIVK